MCLFCNESIIDVDIYCRDNSDFMFVYDDDMRMVPNIQIWCEDITKIPAFTSTIPFSVEIMECNSLIEIDEITTIPELLITDCDNLQRIGLISNMKKLILWTVPQLISIPVLEINNIDNCSNFMDLIHPTYRIIKNSKIIEQDSKVKDCFDYKKVKSGLDKFQKIWRLHKFINLCKSRPFNEYFWNPNNMGGRWHINKMNKMITSF